MSARDEQAGNGVMPLLLWTAVTDSAARGLTFDMDGIGHAGLVLLFAGFGGRITPRFEPIRETRLYATARIAGTLLRGRQDSVLA